MALPATPHGRIRPLITRPLIAGALALALALGVLAWVATTRLGGDDDAQRQREAAMSQARQFMLRIGTYGPDQLDEQGRMPAYADSVREVITPKFAADFDKEGGRLAEQLVAQGGVSRDAEVFSTGISSLDADSAVALVAGTFTDSYPDKGKHLVAQEPVPVRLSVQLVKVDGDWLVDDFGPAGGAR